MTKTINRLGKALLGISVAAFFSMCSSPESKTKVDETTTEDVEEQETATATAQTVSYGVANADTGKQDEVKVKIETDYGTMIVKLYNETPLHRDNFIKLVKSGFYNDLLFHRVIQGFMIQGGDPNSKGAAPGVHLGNGGPGYTIPAEFNPNLIHKKGALAAARLGDQANPKKESSGSQFYIVQGRKYDASQFAGSRYTPEQINTYATVGGTPQLDMGYTVFGEVVEGLDVIDKIAAVQTQPGDRPVTDVKMQMSIVE